MKNIDILDNGDDIDIEYEEDEDYLEAVQLAKRHPDKLMDYTRDNIINHFHSVQIIDWVKEFSLQNNRKVVNYVLMANDFNAIINWHMTFDTFADVLVNNIITTRNSSLALEWINTFNENVPELKQVIIQGQDIYVICRWILFHGDDLEIRESVIRNNRVADYVDIISNETGATDEDILHQLYNGMPNEYKIGVIL